MTTLLPRISFAAATVLLASLTGTSASAQSSACYQTCRIQYNWPASQCASYCSARQSERNAAARARVSGYTSSPTRVYGYTSRETGDRGWNWLGCR